MKSEKPYQPSFSGDFIKNSSNPCTQRLVATHHLFRDQCLRQRISRLVRKTLSFSKKLENHIGAIWMFIHDYNRRVREKLAAREESVFPSVLY